MMTITASFVIIQKSQRNMSGKTCCYIFTMKRFFVIGILVIDQHIHNGLKHGFVLCADTK